MKMFALLALALPLSAWSVDYSRCSFPFEVQVDPEGAVTPSSWFQASDIRTEGNRTTMTVRPKPQPNFNGGVVVVGPQQEPKRIVIERDDQGRIIAMTSGGERPSDATIRQYRQMQNYPGGGYVAGSQGGLVGGYGGGINIGSMSPSLGLGFLVPLRRNGTTEMVKAEELTDSDLTQIGVRGIKATELRAGAQEWSRSSKTQLALRQIQDYSNNNFPFGIPVGVSHQFTFVDGACMPDKISHMTYLSSTDRVESQTIYDREDCQHVKTGWERHIAKMNECRAYDNNQIAVEYNRLVADGHIQPANQGGLVGGIAGGYVAGGVGGGLGGGTANTSGSGYGSDSGAGHYGYNPYTGSGYFSPGSFGGSPRQNLETNYNLCQIYERSWNQGLQGSSTGANFGGGGATQY